MTLTEYVLHQMREMKREMLAAVDGLSDEDVRSHEPGDYNPISWMMQHCCVNVDFLIHKGLTGEFYLEHEQRFLDWPLDRPQPGDSYPPLAELIERWSTLADAAVAQLQTAPEGFMEKASLAVGPTETLAESCLRSINHQNAHLRQIWCIVGRKRIDQKWPTQEAWLP